MSIVDHDLFVFLGKNGADVSDDAPKSLLVVAQSEIFVWSNKTNVLYCMDNTTKKDKKFEELVCTVEFPVEFEADSILLNRTEKLMALVGKQHCYVMSITRRKNQLARCETMRVGSHHLSTHPDEHILQATWHPLGDSHLLILFSDGSLRMYNVSGDHTHSEQSFTMYGKDIVAFTFGIGAGWEQFAIYLVSGSGELYVMCPVIPNDCIVPQEVIVECQQAPPVGSLGDSRRAKTWLLDRTAERSDDASWKRVSAQPQEYHLRPRLQGPLLARDCEGRATSLHLFSDAPGVILVAFEGGVVDVLLIFGPAGPAWVSRVQEATRPHDDVVLFERLNLCFPPNTSSFPSRFFSDPLYPDRVYCAHACGLHTMLFPWVEAMRVFSLSSDAASPIDVSKLPSSRVQWGRITRENGKSPRDNLSGLAVSTSAHGYGGAHTLLSISARGKIEALEMSPRVVLDVPAKPSKQSIANDDFDVVSILSDLECVNLPTLPAGQGADNADTLKFFNQICQSVKSDYIDKISAAAFSASRRIEAMKERQKENDAEMTTLEEYSRGIVERNLTIRQSIENLMEFHKNVLVEFSKALVQHLAELQPVLSEAEVAYFNELKAAQADIPRLLKKVQNLESKVARLRYDKVGGIEERVKDCLQLLAQLRAAAVMPSESMEATVDLQMVDSAISELDVFAYELRVTSKNMREKELPREDSSVGKVISAVDALHGKLNMTSAEHEIISKVSELDHLLCGFPDETEEIRKRLQSSIQPLDHVALGDLATRAVVALTQIGPLMMRWKGRLEKVQRLIDQVEKTIAMADYKHRTHANYHDRDMERSERMEKLKQHARDAVSVMNRVFNSVQNATRNEYLGNQQAELGKQQIEKLMPDLNATDNTLEETFNGLTDLMKRVAIFDQ